MKRILLTGKTGQVGFELQRALSPLGEVIAVGRRECDLSDAEALRHLIRESCPDFIVNAAAYTAVDRAESDLKTAMEVNAQAPALIGEEAARLGALVIHYSTDYVFNGEKGSPYVETDTPLPQSVYGASKLEGERALSASGARHFVFRTSWVVGAHGGNFAKTILRLAETRGSLNVVADQQGAPTSAALLADVTAQLIGRVQPNDVDQYPFGIYHVTASGETNWFDYARYVVGAALVNGSELKTTPERVYPITTAEYPTPAKRPANSRLDTSKFQNTFDLVLPDWRQGVDHILKQIT